MSFIDTNVLVHATADIAPYRREARAALMRLSHRATFGGRQVHDANIVATMLAHRETRLLTFNAADFRRFGALNEVVTP